MLEVIMKIPLQWIKGFLMLVKGGALAVVRWVIIRELWRGWIHRETAVPHEIYTEPPEMEAVWRIRGYYPDGTKSIEEWERSEEKARGRGGRMDNCVVKNIDTGAIIIAQGKHPPQNNLPERAEEDRYIRDIPF